LRGKRKKDFSFYDSWDLEMDPKNFVQDFQKGDFEVSLNENSKDIATDSALQTPCRTRLEPN
jgi:hypothetical protein